MSEFFSHPIPAVVILLGMLVLVHEAGHFVVGRLCGIAVEVFSIGFGPRIFGFTYKGTDYRLSWVPLGGYVKFAGAHPSEEVPPGLSGRSFLETSLFKRALTVLAGPLANFLLAVGVYTVLGYDGIPHPPPLIGEVIEGSPAEVAGLKYGDKLVRIGDRDVVTWRDLEDVISSSPGKPLDVTVERAGQPVKLTLTPGEVKTTDMAGRPVTIGRAGVALGSLPPVVTVLDARSAGAEAGLQTGDRIDELTFGAESRKLKFFPDLLQAVQDAVKSDAATVTLKVEASPAPTEKGPAIEARPGENTRNLVLDLRPAKDLSAASPKEMLRALGLADAQLTVADATEGAAGQLQRGDRVLAWNGTPIKDIYGLREALIANDKPEVTLTVLRDSRPVDVKLQLKGIDAQKPEGTVTVYTLPVLFWGQPVEPDPVIERYASIPAAVAYGVRETRKQTVELVRNVASLFTGDIPLKSLGGPMLIAKVAGDSARRGWQTFLGSMALISVNLGLLNLFPIPVLDGGQLVLMGAEGVRRRPLREAAVENFQKVGFAMILALVVLATYNDLSRFWKSMLESVVGIFQ